MASLKTITHENLVRLGADRLATLLVGFADDGADVKRRLRLELASEAGGQVIAAQVSKRLAAIRTARSFLDWRKQRDFAKDLDLQRAMIVERVAGAEPDMALDLMWRFLDLAGPVLTRVDDSNGTIGDIFRTGCEDLGIVAAGAGSDPVKLADRVYAAISANDCGIYDRLVEAMLPALGVGGIARLKERLTIALAEQQKSASRRTRGDAYLQRALQTIADHEGDADAFAALIPLEDLSRSDIGAELGRRLLAAGRVPEALAVLETAKPGRRERATPLQDGLLIGGYAFGQTSWEDVFLDALEASDRGDDAQALRWRAFEERLSVMRLRDYLKRLPDFDDDEAKEKAMRHALAYRSFSTALGFFCDWPEPAYAAKLAVTRHAEIDGNAYHLLGPAADLLDARYPLPATVLRRAMIEYALNGAKHTRYKHAARHLLECESLVPVIEDYGAFEDHRAFVARLRVTNARKVGFWVQLDEMAGTGLS